MSYCINSIDISYCIFSSIARALNFCSHCDSRSSSSSGAPPLPPTLPVRRLSWSQWLKLNFTKPNLPSLASATYPANSPIEDRCLTYDDTYNSGLVIGAVFDGHGGWQVADFVSSKIIDLFRHNLMQNCMAKMHTNDADPLQFNEITVEESLLKTCN